MTGLIDLSLLGKIEGLSAAERALFVECVEIWSEKLAKNAIRMMYYRNKNPLKDFGVSIPQKFKKHAPRLGWAEKAVETLAARSIFDGFSLIGDEEATNRLLPMVRESAIKRMYRQAVRSAMLHSCAFVTVSKGLPFEPSAVVSVFTAESAAAIWDGRSRRIKAGITVVDVERKTLQPKQINLYTDKAVFVIERHSNKWIATRLDHGHGRPLMEALVYRPMPTRPFGQSRINEGVRSAIDGASRILFQMNVAAEFYAAPQRYLVGVDKEFAQGLKDYDARLASIFAVTRGKDDTVPQYGQLSQMSFQPYLEAYRLYAADFAGKAGIPVNYMGIIHDNPASAEAMYAASEELIIEANNFNEDNTDALRTIAMLMMATSQGVALSDLGDTEKTIMPRFKEPARPSLASLSDAMLKQASTAQWFSQSQVFWEHLGYSEDQVARIMNDMKTIQARATLREIFGSDNGTGN